MVQAQTDRARKTFSDKQDTSARHGKGISLTAPVNLLLRVKVLAAPPPVLKTSDLGKGLCESDCATDQEPAPLSLLRLGFPYGKA